jgi:dimethylhistidine N-methyltransferase
MRGAAVNRVEVDPVEPTLPASPQFAEAMLRALRGQPRAIAPKFFYDRQGVALFERICQLDEYYLTRTEIAILRQNALHIARLIGPRADLVEFGAGSPLKARIVLEALQEPARYVPVDLSVEYLDGAKKELQRAHPGLLVEPVAADFARSLALPERRPGDGHRVGLFLGSTIGNLSPEQAQAFLADAAVRLQGGALLVGVDLVKDPAVLHRAYNDAHGVTAAFNRNLLARANRELGADFDPASFDHYAFYNPGAQRIEMHLVSTRRQSVHVCGCAFEFAKGESLHTEDSYKYTIEGFGELAERAGWAPAEVWCDPQRLFSVHRLIGTVRPPGRPIPPAEGPQRRA